MRPGVEPHHVSDMKIFPPSTLACLEDQPAGTFSGFFKGKMSLHKTCSKLKQF